MRNKLAELLTEMGYFGVFLGLFIYPVIGLYDLVVDP